MNKSSLHYRTKTQNKVWLLRFAIGFAYVLFMLLLKQVV